MAETYDALGHGRGERLVVLEHVEEQRRVDLLQMQVPDPVRTLLDEPQVVAAVVREVTGIEAQVRVAGIGLIEEPIDLACGADMAVGMRVELLLHSELFEQRLAETIVTGAEFRPLLISQRAGLQHFARGVAAPQIRDDDEVLGSELRSEAGHREGLIPRALPLVLPLVEPGEDGPGRQLQPATAEFIRQLVRVGRQIAVRTELDPLVAGRDDLIEKAVPRNLLRVVGKPHTP